MVPFLWIHQREKELIEESHSDLDESDESYDPPESWNLYNAKREKSEK